MTAVEPVEHTTNRPCVHAHDGGMDGMAVCSPSGLHFLGWTVDMRSPGRVIYRECKTLLRSAKELGFKNPRLEVLPDGTLVLIAENQVFPSKINLKNVDDELNPWDDVSVENK